jgi:hypothetical protein
MVGTAEGGGLLGWTVWRSYELSSWTPVVAELVRSKDNSQINQSIDGSVNLNMTRRVFYGFELT